MKHVSTLFVIAILVTSMLPGVFAQEDEQGLNMPAMRDKNTDPTVMKKELVAERARSAENANECAKILTDFNPGIERARALQICTSAYGHAAPEGLNTLNTNRLRTLEAEKSQKLERLAQDEATEKKLELLSRARLKEYAELDEDALRTRLENMNVVRVKKEELFRQRELAQERIETAREKYQQAKERYENEKKLFEEERLSWRNAVDEGDEQGAVDHAKAYLTHAGNLVIEALNKAKAEAEGNDDLTEEEVTAIITNINENIVRMEEAIADVEAAQTKDEVKEAGRTILAAWERTRERLREHLYQSYDSNVGEILARSEQLERRLENILERLEGQGYDVSEIQDLVDEFSRYITSAKDNYKQAQGLFEQSRTDDDRESFDQAKELTRQAHEDLNEASSILVDIWKKVKEISPDEELEDDDEYVEIIEEEDSESDEESDDNTEMEDDTP